MPLSISDVQAAYGPTVALHKQCKTTVQALSRITSENQKEVSSGGTKGGKMPHLLELFSLISACLADFLLKIFRVVVALYLKYSKITVKLNFKFYLKFTSQWPKMSYKLLCIKENPIASLTALPDPHPFKHRQGVRPPDLCHISSKCRVPTDCYCFTFR